MSIFYKTFFAKNVYFIRKEDITDEVRKRLTKKFPLLKEKNTSAAFPY